VIAQNQVGRPNPRPPWLQAERSNEPIDGTAAAASRQFGLLFSRRPGLFPRKASKPAFFLPLRSARPPTVPPGPP